MSMRVREAIGSNNKESIFACKTQQTSQKFFAFCVLKLNRHLIIQARYVTHMAEYRTRIRIIGDILTTTRDDIENEHGSTVSYLIKKTNVPHHRLSRILQMLAKQGLIEIEQSGASNKYKISENGREFLQAYRAFTEFANDYGLNI